MWWEKSCDDGRDFVFPHTLSDSTSRLGFAYLLLSLVLHFILLYSPMPIRGVRQTCQMLETHSDIGKACELVLDR